MSATTVTTEARTEIAPATLARFMAKVNKTETCWLWTGAIGTNGYGRMKVDGRVGYAHRVSFLAYVGQIPAGHQIDHLCRVRSCCNPGHLEAVLPQINTRRGESPGARALRREACLHDHPYAEHGTVVNGRRICRLCRLTYMRLWKQVPYIEAMRRKAAGEPVVDLAAHFADQRRQERAA